MLLSRWTVAWIVIFMLAPACLAAQETKAPSERGQSPAATAADTKPGDAEPDAKPLPLDIPKAVELLRSKDRKARGKAVRQLYEAGPKAKAAVPGILAVLNEEDIEAHTDLFFVLEAIGPDAKPAIPYLLTGIKHENFHVRYLACRALAGIGPESREAIPQLLTMLEKEVASVRKHAALALGKIGRDQAPEIVEPLLGRLDDTLHPVRAAAIEALSLVGKNGDAAVPRLKEVVANKRSTVRTQAARTLWKLTGKVEPSVSALREQLQSQSEPWLAAQVLGEIGADAEDSVDDLIQFTRSEEPTMRLFGAEALGKLGPAAKAALPRLRELLEDSEEGVRARAEAAIKQIEGGAP